LRWEGWNVRFIVFILFMSSHEDGFMQIGLQKYCFFLI